MQDLKVAACNLNLRDQCKINRIVKKRMLLVVPEITYCVHLSMLLIDLCNLMLISKQWYFLKLQLQKVFLAKNSFTALSQALTVFFCFSPFLLVSISKLMKKLKVNKDLNK